MFTNCQSTLNNLVRKPIPDFPPALSLLYHGKVSLKPSGDWLQMTKQWVDTWTSLPLSTRFTPSLLVSTFSSASKNLMKKPRFWFHGKVLFHRTKAANFVSVLLTSNWYENCPLSQTEFWIATTLISNPPQIRQNRH